MPPGSAGHRVGGEEGLFTRLDLKPLFEHPKIPILQPDVVNCGRTNLRKIVAKRSYWKATL